MRVYASKLEQSTCVSPDDMMFHEERRAVRPHVETTSAIDEIYNLRETPAAVVLEPQVAIVNDWESLTFLALKDIQEVASGKLTDWREEDHLGEKFLFEIVKRKPRA